MATTKVKKGDTGVNLLRQLLTAGTAVDVSASNYLILHSAELTDATSMAARRDVTIQAKANGTPADGKLALPLWTGRTLPGTASGVVTVANNAADGKITVTAAAGGSGTVTQEIYMTISGAAVGGTYYLAVSGADGFAVGGYDVSVADASLTQTVPSVDESATYGNASALPAAPTPTAALAGAGAGLCTNGPHYFKIINKRATDTDTVRTVNFEIIVYNNATGKDITWPEDGFEVLDIRDDI